MSQTDPLRDSSSAPIPMLLFCPLCWVQHVDEPDERTPGWTNPPHRSHLCHACGCIWRPADVPTVGVRAISTRGKKDTWPADETPVVHIGIDDQPHEGRREDCPECNAVKTSETSEPEHRGGPDGHEPLNPRCQCFACRQYKR